MTQQTDYNAFEHPVPNSESTEDEDQWAPVLDALFEDQVDETIIKRGALSDRPPAGSSKDVANYPRLYLATDQTPPLLSYDNDTEWVDVNPFSLYAALGQNETVTGSWTFNNEVDGAVRRATKTFGTMVNGGHSDFSSAQAAIDFANTNGYHTVVYPPGTYGGITIPAGLRVTGQSMVSGGHEVLFSVSSGVAVSMGSSVLLENCVAESTGTASSDHAVTTAFRSTVRNVRFSGAGGDGLNSNDGNAILVADCDVNEGNIAGNSCTLTSNSTNCIVTNNRAFGGIVNNGTGNLVTDNT